MIENPYRCIGGPLAGSNVSLLPGVTQFTAPVYREPLVRYCDVKPGSLENLQTGSYLLKRTCDGELVYAWNGLGGVK